MSQIGAILPAFQKYAQTFAESHQIQHLLSLFYLDILDFYDTMLSFFKNKSRLEESNYTCLDSITCTDCVLQDGLSFLSPFGPNLSGSSNASWKTYHHTKL